jgi:hypothetical protein
MAMRLPKLNARVRFPPPDTALEATAAALEDSGAYRGLADALEPTFEKSGLDARVRRVPLIEINREGYNLVVQR